MTFLRGCSKTENCYTLLVCVETFCGGRPVLCPKLSLDLCRIVLPQHSPLVHWHTWLRELDFDNRGHRRIRHVRGHMDPKASILSIKKFLDSKFLTARQNAGFCIGRIHPLYHDPFPGNLVYEQIECLSINPAYTIWRWPCSIRYCDPMKAPFS